MPEQSLETSGLCPVCRKWVEAVISDKGREGVFLVKDCPEHGTAEVLLSRHSGYFLGLREFYFRNHRKIYPQNRYLLLLTSRCNLGCPICFLGDRDTDLGEINGSDLEGLTAKSKFEFVLFGAEPTCHDDIFGIIRRLKETQGSVTIFTNGVKLDAFDYARKLKASGIDKIYLQFDGFDDRIYETLRAKPLLESKLRALDTIKKARLPATLVVTVAKNVNDHEAGRVFDYALENSFIKSVDYVAYSHGDGARNYLSGNYLMPDQVADLLIEHTKARITREGLYAFQKLLYVYMSLLKRRTCFYIQYYWIYRLGEGKYLPIEEIIDLKKVENVMDRYTSIKERSGSFVARVYLLAASVTLVTAIKNFRIFGEWLKVIAAHMLRKEYADQSRSFLMLIFSTGCDVHKADRSIAERCHCGVAYKDRGGKMHLMDENGFYLLKKEMSGVLK